MKAVTIAGGGLAGLMLGNLLARRGVPVTLHEAGRLRRHRVCGEFICGRGAALLRENGLGDCLNGSLAHRSTAWYFRERSVLKARLPDAADGLSRYRLDPLLGERLQSLGGSLLENSRLRFDPEALGVVDCSGRPVTKSPWIGLKLHCRQLPTRADLELHLGDRAYLGLSRVEDGRTNVCGLFVKRPEVSAGRDELLPAYLRACGLSEIAQRIESGSVDPDSHAAVAGVGFGTPTLPPEGPPRLGDALGVIPPFTGNGMSIAIESATIAAGPLLRYASGRSTWEEASAQCREACLRRFRTRIRFAGWLHPWLSQPGKQKLMASLARTRLLPFRALYSLTH